jgi:hypothetical protein
MQYKCTAFDCDRDFPPMYHTGVPDDTCKDCSALQHRENENKPWQDSQAYKDFMYWLDQMPEAPKPGEKPEETAEKMKAWARG